MRVFISHGTDLTKEKPAGFLFRLFDRLREAKHLPLLDRRTLRPGDPWEDVLHDALADCQAAVLVLSERALERPWVMKEAAILSFRKKREPDFALFSVLLDGLTMDRLRQAPAFAALGLDDYQGFASDVEADTVADWVIERLAPLAPASETPMDKLVMALQARLAQADVVQLEALCEALVGGATAWVPFLDRPNRHARALACAIVSGRWKSLAIADLVKRLKQAALGGESLRTVRELVAPIWVDPAVAGRFGALAHAGDEVPFAGAFVSAHWKYSSRMLAWRSQLPDTSDFVFWIPGGHSDAREEEIVAEIRRLYRKADPDIDDDEEVDVVLRARTQPLVVVLPKPVPDDALLLALHKLYPKVLFLAHAGSADPAEGSLPGAVVLLPLGVSAAEEAERFADFSAAREV